MEISNSNSVSQSQFNLEVFNNKALKQRAEALEKKATDNSQVHNYKKAQLQEVGEGFEKIFIDMMFKSMRNTLQKEDDILYGGFSQDIFEDMLYDKYSEEFSKSHYLGISKLIISQYEDFI